MPCAFQLTHPQRRASGCQFGIAEHELIEFDLKMWCPFHLPLRTGEAETAKAWWDREQFNEAIFARIDEARKANTAADLSGIVFPAEISFDRYDQNDSLPEVLLLKATFDEGVRFEGARFSSHARFDGATFRVDASFDDAEFRGLALFDGAEFGGGASFRRAKFNHAASFMQAAFGNQAQFDGAIFCRKASFDGASFRADASFEDKVKFGDISSFRNVKFNGVARFKEATFEKVVGFHGTTFAFLGHYTKVDFKQGATFEGAAFASAAKFEKATFGDNACFLGDPTREGAHAFKSCANFRKAKFAGRALFNNRRFLHSADFREAVFAVAPEFHDAVLHQDTRFAGTQFLDRKGTDEVDAAMAYRTLKLAMANVRATDEEARFHALEQQSLRLKKDTPNWVKLFSWLYEMTADYGQSLALPVFWLFFTFFLFFLLYAWLGGPLIWHNGGSIWRFALQQVFQPFAAFRTSAVPPGAEGQPVPLGLAFLAAVHSLLTLSFLALFLLAVRRRFRLT